MTRLFTLMLTAFVFAFTAPIAIPNAAAQTDDAATHATDDAMGHGSPVNESNKTNKDKGRKHPGHHKAKHAHHAHKHAHKKKASGDTGSTTGAGQ